jgi:hypothetical protein
MERENVDSDEYTDRKRGEMAEEKTKERKEFLCIITGFTAVLMFYSRCLSCHFANMTVILAGKLLYIKVS